MASGGRFKSQNAVAEIIRKSVKIVHQPKTFHENCLVFINVLLFSDKQFLEIKSMNVEHDHQRLPTEYQEKIQKYMNLQIVEMHT